MNMKLLSGLFGVASLLASSVASAAAITLDPSALTVTTGDTFTLTVGATDLPVDTLGGSVRLVWDPTLIELSAGANIGPTIFNAGLDGFSSTMLNVSGSTLDVDVITLSSPQNPTRLFSVDFTVIGTVSANTDISVGAAIDPNAFGWLTTTLGDIPMDYSATTSITVSAVPVPPAVWLFGSGLLGLVGVARRRAA